MMKEPDMKEILQELAELNEPRMMNTRIVEEEELRDNKEDMTYDAIDNQDHLPTTVSSIKVMMDDYAAAATLPPMIRNVKQESVTADVNQCY